MTHDPDNPPPEPSFGWRRTLTYAYTAASSAVVCWIVAKVDDARSLMWIALALVLSNVIFALLYMGGASATDLARILKSAASLRRGG